jgi:hypothetical protein
LIAAVLLGSTSLYFNGLFLVFELIYI